MRFLDLFHLSTRMFKTRLKRTLLTILGVSIGIGAILFLVSLGYGLQRMLLKQITTADALLSLDITPSKAELISLDEKTLNQISEISNVEEISPMASIPGQITLAGLTSDILVYTCHPSYFRLEGTAVKKGELFSKEDERKVIISSALVKSFGLKSEEALGKEVKFTLFLPQKGEEEAVGTLEEVRAVEKEEPYQISGVIEDETASFSYIPLGTLEDLEIKEFTQAKVKVSEAKLMGEVREKIINKGFLVSALSDTIDEANKIFGVMQITLALFGFIALFVAAIGMANTMVVTLLERTNETGIMKSIGASNKDIGRMFLFESIIIGFCGGLGGIGIGFLGSELFNQGVNMLARGLGGQAANLFYTPLWFIIFIIIISTIVGFLAGLFPARTAARLNPLEALRYK